MKNKVYIGCKSWVCSKCIHYVPYQSVSTMHNLCWNNKNLLKFKDTKEKHNDSNSKSSNNT